MIFFYVYREDILTVEQLLFCLPTGNIVIGNIGRVSLARENEAGGSWGQEVHILHVNV